MTRTVKRYPQIGPHKKLRESKIEAWAVQVARNCGWYTRKYKTPSRRSAPDRIFAKHGRVFWIEFKAWGDVPSDLQAKEHALMRGYGLTVYVCNSKESFMEVFQPEDEAMLWLD